MIKNNNNLSIPHLGKETRNGNVIWKEDNTHSFYYTTVDGILVLCLTTGDETVLTYIKDGQILESVTLDFGETLSLEILKQVIGYKGD